MSLFNDQPDDIMEAAFDQPQELRELLSWRAKWIRSFTLIANSKSLGIEYECCECGRIEVRITARIPDGWGRLVHEPGLLRNTVKKPDLWCCSKACADKYLAEHPEG